MTQAWWLVGLVLWTAWTVQALLSVLLVKRFYRGLTRKPRAAHEVYRPPAAVIVPFKGVELGLEENVRRLFAQDYADYRLLLVVESEDDPAYALLRRVAAGHPSRTSEIVVAGEAGDHEGQKVHNLLAALARLDREGMPVEALVFADSDAAADPAWLTNLIGPLVFDHTGVTTGYRWMVPADDALPSRLASVVNSSVAVWAGRERYNHAWGGSMAMRVATAREGDLVGRWRGALSDDYQVSRMCKDLGKRIYFVHRCLVATPVTFTWRSLFEFGRRQYVITRTHAPWLYVGGLFVTTTYVLGFLGTTAGLVTLLWTDAGGLGWLLPLAAILIQIVAAIVRVAYRRRAIEAAFDEPRAETLRPALALDRLTAPHMFVHWLIVLAALIGRTITWRGKRYRIDGPQRIARLS